MQLTVGQRYRIVKLGPYDNMYYIADQLIGQVGVLVKGGDIHSCSWFKLDNERMFLSHGAFRSNTIQMPYRGTCFSEGLVLEPEVTYTPEELAAWQSYDLEDV